MIALALFAAEVAPAAALPTVFGLELGAPIALPECQRMPARFLAPGVKPPYSSVQIAPCQQLPGEYGPGTETDGLVRFPPDKLPAIVGVDIMETTVLNGRLEALSAATLSYNSAPGIVRELTAKFGAPTARETETVLVEKIAVPSIHVTWSRPGYSVDYHSVAENEIDYGDLTIETDAGRAARVSKERARDALRTPL